MFNKIEMADSAENEGFLKLSWSPGSLADKYRSDFFPIFGKGKWHWCAAFVRWNAIAAGLDVPIKCPSKFGYTFALVEAWQQWAIEKGFYIDHKKGFEPERGDIVCFDWSQISEDERDTDWENHIGIYLRRSGSNYQCAEGNSGGRTGIFNRSSKQIQGWIRIPDGYSFSGPLNESLPPAPITSINSVMFQEAVKKVLEAEGGYVDLPEDRGGPTNWGITLATLASWRGKKVTAADVKALSQPEAVQIYKARYWDAMNLDLVKNRRIALLLFDQGVNRGTKTAIRMMQETLKIYLGQAIGVDGELGPKTAEAIESVKEVRLVVYYVSHAQDKYVEIAKRDPSQMKFIAGWINRTQSLLELIWT